LNRRWLVVAAVVLLPALAVAFYRQVLYVPQYVHSGATTPQPPSRSLPADAVWIDLFDGKSLAGWIPKFRGRPAGENYRETFSVTDGAITVDYSAYHAWDGEFGHLFYHRPFSRYILQLEYRFRGEQLADSLLMRWAWRNSGVMIHSEAPAGMRREQDFPVSLEVQLLGAAPGDHRPTANLCTPGTHVELGGRLHTAHCTHSLSASHAGDEWVTVELEVLAGERVRHFVNGRFVLEYTAPQLDGAEPDAARLLGARSDAETGLDAGYIALQSESHPVQFRRIRLYPLD
jgi:hypothetical protein